MKQFLENAGAWIAKQQGISRLYHPGRPAAAVAAIALLVFATALVLYATPAGIFEGFRGEPKPTAIILLGIGLNGIAGVAIHRNRK